MKIGDSRSQRFTASKARSILSAAQNLVAEMHEADQKSDGFRFPTDRGDSPFAFGDRGIDLANVREVMEGLTNFFECVYLDFSHQDDITSEAR